MPRQRRTPEKAGIQMTLQTQLFLILLVAGAIAAVYFHKAGFRLTVVSPDSPGAAATDQPAEPDTSWFKKQIDTAPRFGDTIEGQHETVYPDGYAETENQWTKADADWLGQHDSLIHSILRLDPAESTRAVPTPETASDGEQTAMARPVPETTVTPRDPGWNTAVVVGDLELYPTYSAIGIEVRNPQDINSNASASFEWKPAGETTWRRGVMMTHDPKRRLHWASIFPLEQNQAIDVRVTVKDPELAEPRLLEAQVTTRQMILESTTGGTIFVSAQGDDSNAGTRERPLKSLAFAGNLAGPGDTILALDGVYREQELFSFLRGLPGKPIIIAAAPGHKPILDGSTVIASGQSQWQATSAPGVWRLKREFTEISPIYAAQNNQRMYRYTALQDLVEDRNAARRAWHYDVANQALYVRTGTNQPPDRYEYHLSPESTGIRLEGSRHLVIRGFTMRYFGKVAVHLTSGTRDCIIIDNVIHNTQVGILLAHTNTHDNAIWRNHIYEQGLTDFTWEGIKASNFGRQGIYIHHSGRGNSICENTIHDWFDGIAPISWRNPENIEIDRDMDIMRNTIFNIGDDAIELDGGGVNMRVHANHIRNAFVAISMAPIERGPVYVTRNHATYKMMMFKLNVAGVTSLGHAHVYHNSGYSLAASGGLAMIGLTGVIPIENKYFANNAIIGNGDAIRDGTSGNFFDHNCYWHTPKSGRRGFGWDRRHYGDIKAFNAASGQEGRGMYADPRFAGTPGLGALDSFAFTRLRASDHPLARDANHGNFRPAGNSPLIDRGAIIPGINDQYKGRAPDIGAFEAGM